MPTKKPSGKSPAEPTAGGFDLSVVAALAKIAAHHDLSEVEIEHAGLRVRVARKRHAPVELSHVVAAPAPAPAPPVEAAVVAPAELAGAE